MFSLIRLMCLNYFLVLAALVIVLSTPHRSSGQNAIAYLGLPSGIAIQSASNALLAQQATPLASFTQAQQVLQQASVPAALGLGGGLGGGFNGFGGGLGGGINGFGGGLGGGLGGYGGGLNGFGGGFGGVRLGSFRASGCPGPVRRGGSASIGGVGDASGAGTDRHGRTARGCDRRGP